eukprot:scaffold106005_cov36-Prasinocladus_malaysianus.AAC.1
MVDGDAGCEMDVSKGRKGVAAAHDSMQALWPRDGWEKLGTLGRDKHPVVETFWAHSVDGGARSYNSLKCGESLWLPE